MRQLAFLAGFILFLSLKNFSQQEEVISRIILIGDAGKLTAGKIPAVEKARLLFNVSDGKTSVIYLGDNVYEYGLPDTADNLFKEKKAILDAQISLVQGGYAKAYFIPGNHDWKKGKTGGWQRVINQQQYIESLQMANVEMMPKNGCPGPVERVINDKVVIVFIDSQWWLQKVDKPGVDSDCTCKTETEIITALRKIIAVHSDKLLLVATHHPFYTHGPHGGYFTLKQHIFPLTDAKPGLYIPLPVIGSVYPLVRTWLGAVPQDRSNPNYKRMIKEIEAAMKTHPNAIHVAGHEHTLQFLQKDGISYAVSGAGAKTTRVKKGKHSLFAKKEKGFAVVEVMQSGKVTISFYGEKSENATTPLFTIPLKSIELAAKKETGAVTTASYFPEITFRPEKINLLKR
jgi:hypothetical protein